MGITLYDHVTQSGFRWSPGGNSQLMLLRKEVEATTTSQFCGKSSSSTFHCSSFRARIQKLRQVPITPPFRTHLRFAERGSGAHRSCWNVCYVCVCFQGSAVGAYNEIISAVSLRTRKIESLSLGWREIELQFVETVVDSGLSLQGRKRFSLSGFVAVALVDGRSGTNSAMFLQQAFRTASFISYGYMNFTQGAFLKHAKEFQNADMAVDLTNKQCVVTGANQGIGFASAEALAARGATVHLVCRSKERGEKAVEEIKAKTGNQNVSLEVCDLSSLQQVRDFAAKYTSTNQPLHILVNNAGLMENERTLTADGLETNFAVNVAGVYVMTELLMPALKLASPDSRVITVASGGMLTENLTENLQYEDKKKFDGTAQYARNKRVQVALTENWAQKHKDSVGFYSMHPGWVDTGGLKKSMPGFHAKFQTSMRTLDEGADTITWLGLQPNAKLQNGEFYFDRKVTTKHLPGCGTKYAPELVETVVSKIRSLCGLSPKND